MNIMKFLNSLWYILKIWINDTESIALYFSFLYFYIILYRMYLCIQYDIFYHAEFCYTLSPDEPHHVINMIIGYPH